MGDMSLLGGEGPYCISVLWGLTALLFVVLIIRIYTRVVCVASYGIDDTFFVITIAIIVAYASLGTVACLYGYGRDDLDPAQTAEMTFWRMAAQTPALLGTATSKASVGFFMLRLVAKRWHKITIYVVLGIMSILSVVSATLTWVGCEPFNYVWDERIEGGKCIDTVPAAAAMAFFTVVADIVFVVLAWLFVWKLSNPLQEKILLGGSLSLGVFAAVAGTIRMLSVKGVRHVPIAVFVWSQVELTTTLVCVGIPVCLPLWRIMWRRVRTIRTRSKKSTANSSSDDHHNAEGGRGDPSFEPRGGGGVEAARNEAIGLYTIGGTPMHPQAVAAAAQQKKKPQGRFSSVFSLASSTAKTRVEESRVRADDGSDEVKLTTSDWEDSRRTPRRDSASCVGTEHDGSSSVRL